MSSTTTTWVVDSNTNTSSSAATNWTVDSNTNTSSSSTTKWTKGGAASSAAFNNYSLAFDGTNDYVDMGDVAAFDGLAAFSFSVWFKSSNADPDDGIWGKGEGTLGARSGIDIFYDSEEIYVDITTNTGEYRANTIGDVFTANGTWYHVVAVYNGSTIVIYKDASVVKTQASVTGTTTVPSLNLWIGRRHVDSDVKYFTGNMDDMAFWDVALSADDVTAIYNSGVPNDLTDSSSYNVDRTGGLQGYWKFEEGNGTTATDSSDGDNDGTISGATYDGSVGT